LTEPHSVPPAGKRRLSFGSFSIPVPESRPLRIGLGILLCLGGFLWFLPVLGLWMLPLGLLVLSIDIPVVRRCGDASKSGGGGGRERKGRSDPALKSLGNGGVSQGKTRASWADSVNNWLTA
jgi:hypothetical protein